MRIDETILSYLDEITQIRRSLHRIPELALKEHKTQKFILKYLSALGLKPEKVAGTGIKQVFLTPGAKKTIGFRADIDGLTMQELNETDYASGHEGLMHACGHDGHTSILLMLAKYLTQNRDKLSVNVVLLFQPGEELLGGAKLMIEAECLKNPDIDVLYGLHLWPEIEIGKVGLREGPTMAATSEINVNITGKSAHGASPQKGIDAIVVAAQFIQMVQTIVTRSVNPYEKALITIGKIRGGESRNILPERVKMQGTVRTFKESVYIGIRERILDILQGLEISTGVKTKFTEVMRYPVLDNPMDLNEELVERLEYEDIVFMNEMMAAEDLSFYQQQIPALFFFLGIGTENSLHSNLFDFDERALLGGLEIYRRILFG